MSVESPRKYFSTEAGPSPFECPFDFWCSGNMQKFLSATIRDSTKNVYEAGPLNFPATALTSAETSAASKRYGSFAGTCAQLFFPMTQKQASVRALKTLR